MKKHFFYLLALCVMIGFGCQKELSFEGSNEPAEGSLQDDVTGDCLPKTVNGTYSAAVALVPATNTITVAVDVTKTGPYVVTTDTVNGYYFRATGTFTTLGITNVTLRGNGTPFAQGINNFVVSFDSTVCDIQVTVASAGAGTLAGSPNACAPIAVNGGYSPGVALTAANNAVVQVNVTTAGSFNITTDTVAGVWFNFSGTLAAGPQSVTLQAQGAIAAGTTPGPRTFNVKLGTSICTFVVNITAPAAGTLNCSSATFTGSYMQGVPLTTTNTVQQISVNVTSTGAYTISTDTVNGCWFNTSGTFTATGATNITLVGNGTPANSGPFTFTVKFGPSTCTFSCTFNPPDYFPRTTNSNWSYEWDADPTDSLLRFAIANTNINSFGTFNIFMQNDGTAPPAGDSSGYYRRNGGDYFEYFNLGDVGLDNNQWVEYTFLKDNVPVGNSWTSTGWTNSIGGQPITFRFKDSIQSKDISVPQTTSTGNVTYQNVIVVVERIQVQVGPTWQDATSVFGYFKYYYARGIGLIKLEVFDPPGTSTTPSFVQRLRRYQIF